MENYYKLKMATSVYCLMKMTGFQINIEIVDAQTIFTESAPRLIQSISCNVRLFLPKSCNC